MAGADMFLRALPSLEKRREPDVIAGFVLPPIQISSAQHWQQLQVQLIENCWQSEVAGLDLRYIRNGETDPATLLLCRIARPSAVPGESFRGYCLGRLQYMQQCLVDAGYNPLLITEAQMLERALQPFPLPALADLRRSEDEHSFKNSNGDFLVQYYMAYPWEWEIQHTWPLTEILAQQPGEWLVSILLQPTRLTMQEQQSLQYVTSPYRVDWLKNSGLLGSTLCRYYELFARNLQRPFLQRITLAASSRAILDSLGTALLRRLPVSDQRPVLQPPGSRADYQTARYSIDRLIWLPWGNRRDGDEQTGRLRYLVDSQGASKAFQLPTTALNSKHVDIAIITVREDEFRAVHKRFETKLYRTPSEFSYYMSRLQIGNVHTTIAITRCSEQGNDAAQKLASDIIHELNPGLILVVGIAGGVPDNEFTLGDVIISTRILNFNVDALHPDGTIDSVTRGGANALVGQITGLLPGQDQQLAGWNAVDSIKRERPDVDLQHLSIVGNDNWSRKVRQSLENHFGRPHNRQRPPLFKTGHVASSNHLVKNPAILLQWLTTNRQILAVEMETAGVYEAAQTIKHQYPVIAIRGISDIVGLQRDQAWTEYACETAAAFTYAFIMTGPIAPRS
jgi:nucleoside phosphorylase